MIRSAKSAAEVKNLSFLNLKLRYIMRIMIAYYERICQNRPLLLIDRSRLARILFAAIKKMLRSTTRQSGPRFVADRT
jgi:hypothetical protein